MANSLTRDFTATPTNAKKFTISFWVRFTKFHSNQSIISNYGNSGNDDFAIQFRNDNTLGIIDWKGAGVANNHESTRTFEDPTSWYHIVVAGDSTESTGSDRLKLYVNGLRETSWASATDIGQNNDYNWNKETDGTSLGHVIGQSGNAGNIFQGNLAHVHNVDGTALTPSTFGETDSTTGEWKPKLNPSYTVGTNGWFLKFENSGALGTDSSGNGATFTVSGNVKQSNNTPSNLFPTLDRFQNGFDPSGTVNNAGTTLLSYANGTYTTNCTMMMSTGKWYWEVKSETDATNESYCIQLYQNGSIAAYMYRYNPNNSQVGRRAEGSGITYFPNESAPKFIFENAAINNYGTQASANDIIMCALDLSNATTGKLWFGKNGTWYNAPGTSDLGNPATGANAGVSFAKGGEYWGISISSGSNAANNAERDTHINFGTGHFGNTAVSSAQSDDAGVGIFEYDPPAGFYAICTKNIKTYG